MPRWKFPESKYVCHLLGKKLNINEVHGSSYRFCFGLENQWEPEKVVLKELKNRIQHGTFGPHELVIFLGLNTPKQHQ